jgi:hypothetical protein
VTGCCECGDEPLGSCAMKLVSYSCCLIRKLWLLCLLALIAFLVPYSVGSEFCIFNFRKHI